MKLLKLCASGIPLLHDKCEIDFTALQRVTEENAEQMSKLFASELQTFHKNNVLSFIGINASGKTTLLKLITFVCRLLNNEPLNSIDCSEVLDGLIEGQQAVLDIYFYADNKATVPFTDNGAINLLQTTIVRKDKKYVISHEQLKSKKIDKSVRKKNLFDFTGVEINMSRQHINAEFLLDDVSIMVAFNKRNKEEVMITDMLQYTNVNQLNISEDCPLELITFFDPSVEYLKLRNNGKDTDICLKFRDKEELILKQMSELNRYLSSGTIKGINIFIGAMRTFKTGGYLIVDELENHFNREIVSTLMRFYMDPKVNRQGATLIFSTHYPELLDEFERNDNIYIVRNRQGITADNLSNILKRNDIKKSEIYQSDFLEGTVPAYDAYMDLKKTLIRRGGEG